jgi:hypothetical protein
MVRKSPERENDGAGDWVKTTPQIVLVRGDSLLRGVVGLGKVRQLRPTGARSQRDGRDRQH